MTDAVASRSAGDLRIGPRRYSAARVAFFRAVERLFRRLGGRRFYRWRFLRAGRFHVRREELRVPDLPVGLDGFRIAHLSDLHAGPFLAEGDLADVVARINAEDVDLVVLTGDLITHGWRESLTLLSEWREVRARHGVLAVFGNHDYRGRAEGRIAEAYGAVGVRFLCNEAQRIDTGHGVLAVVGVEDIEEARDSDVERARQALEPGDVEVVLCHNPSAAGRLARAGCAAVFSGHTHGYQVNVPWVRRIGPPHPGERVSLGSTTLIVSRGLGVVGIPLRVRVPAEWVLVELRAGGGDVAP